MALGVHSPSYHKRNTPSRANSVDEIQAFLVEIIGRFELSMTELSELVYRGLTALISPPVEGELDRGHQLLLVVSLVAREDNS